MKKTSVMKKEEIAKFYGEFYAQSRIINLADTLVPKNLRHLMHYAEFWGISDDWERQNLVIQAPEKVKNNLKLVIEEHDDELDVWLAGPEAASSNPSDAYVAFSAMRMAADFT